MCPPKPFPFIVIKTRSAKKSKYHLQELATPSLTEPCYIKLQPIRQNLKNHHWKLSRLPGNE